VPLLIPYPTDAPIYHRPFGTVALIVANLGVQLNSLRDPFLIFERLCLSIGSGIHPLEWFAYSFSHGHIAFALANMLVLWVFGMIREGKIGWWKFLSLYFVIAIAVGAIIQIGTLWMEPFSVAGASGADFGILVIACFWAPLNEISFVWVLHYRGYYFEATALTTAFMYIAFVFAALIIGLAVQRQRTQGGFDGFHFTPDPLPLFLIDWLLRRPRRAICGARGWDAG
jgi:membrane associated rhomboid family serine protease